MKKALLLLLCGCCLVAAQAQRPNKTHAQIKQLVQQEASYLRGLYLDLHANPELSFKEKETSARMAAELEQLGFEVTTDIGGYGVVGVLKNEIVPSNTMKVSTHIKRST